MPSKKDGETFHRTVELIERSIQTNPDVKIESHKKLTDKDTGRLREHDVLLTIKQNHHAVLLAIECRDRSRPVGVPEVEAFAKKCEKTGINKGIIVTSTGFCKTAIMKARKLDIDCLTIEEAEKFSWCAASSLIQIQRRLKHVTVNIVKKGLEGLKQVKLYDNNGGEINEKEGIQIGANCLNSIKLEENIPDTGVIPFCDIDPEFYFLDVDGTKQKPDELNIVVEYETLKSLVPFKFFNYKNPETNMYTIASADIVAEQIKGKVIIVNEESKGAKVVFIPETSN